MYESRCLICNPASSRVEGNHEDAQPSVETPREGIYIGETSRSLHERALEHMKDAEAFSVKSHITKHWMNSRVGHTLVIKLKCLRISGSDSFLCKIKF